MILQVQFNVYCFPTENRNFPRTIKTEGRLKAYQEVRTLFRQLLHVPFIRKTI